MGNCINCSRELEKKQSPKLRCSACRSRDWYRKNRELNTDSFKNRLKTQRGVHRKKKNQDVNAPVHFKGVNCISNGYRITKKIGHPNAMKNGLIYEHQLVMSTHIGRPLEKHENVHHKNGDRLDNRIENLELWSRSQPPGQRVADKISWCKEFLAQYGYDVIMNLNQRYGG